MKDEDDFKHISTILDHLFRNLDTLPPPIVLSWDLAVPEKEKPTRPKLRLIKGGRLD